MTILDGSAEASGAIRRAIALAAEESTALVILGIGDPFGALTQSDARRIQGADDYVRVVAERELRDIAREAAAAKVPIIYRRVLQGNPLSALRGALNTHQPCTLVIPLSIISHLAPADEPGTLDKVLSRVRVEVTDDQADAPSVETRRASALRGR